MSLFQDTSGLIPANQPGHPVGLVLSHNALPKLGPALAGASYVFNSNNPPNIGSFDPVTFEGVVTRGDSTSIVSTVRLGGSAVSSGMQLKLTIQTGETPIAIRQVADGAIIRTTGTNSTETIYFETTSAGVNISSGANNSIAPFKILEFAEVLQPVARQATTASKPTLARWPKGGRRNLAVGAQNVSGPTPWQNTDTRVGITATKVGYGVEDGEPYVDYRFTGTASGTQQASFFVQGSTMVYGVKVGDTFTVSYTARRLYGSPGSGYGIASDIGEEDSAGSYVGGKSSSPVTSLTDVRVVSTSTITNSNTDRVRVAMLLRPFTAGDEIDVTYRIKGLQFERGAVATPLQFNYGLNDVVEAPKRRNILRNTGTLSGDGWYSYATPQVRDGELGGAPAWKITDNSTSSSLIIACYQTAQEISLGENCFSMRVKKKTESDGILSAIRLAHRASPEAPYFYKGIKFDAFTGEVSPDYFTSTTGERGVIDQGDYWLVYFKFSFTSAVNNSVIQIYPASTEVGSSTESAALTGSITIAAPQWTYGPEILPYQPVTHGFERFEGDDFVWHLYNDGGDSLPTVLPAGTCGYGYVETDGNVTIGTITSDGSTPINVASPSRVVDFVYRSSAFSPSEAQSLREKWEKLYK